MSGVDWQAILCATILALSAWGTPVAADPGGDLSNSLSGDHFVVKYADGYESSAETTLGHLQDIRTELQAATPVDTTLSGKTTVRIHPMDEWQDSRYSLHWHNNPNRIDLIAPADWRTVEHVDRYYIKKNLAHEYANIMLYEYASGDGSDYWSRYPSWFGEGLSEYYAYHNVSDDIQRNYDPEVNEFKQKVRDGSGYFAVLAQDRYSGGHLLMHYVIDEYGEKAVFGMLRNDAETFEKIVESELAVSYDVFKKKWLLWAETNIGGDYSVSEEEVSKSARIDSLENRLDRKNGTIAEYRRRLDSKNETIARLQAEIESLNRSLRRARQNVTTTRTDVKSNATTTQTDAEPNASEGQQTTTAVDTDSKVASESFVAGLAGGSLLGVALAGVALLLRR